MRSCRRGAGWAGSDAPDPIKAAAVPGRCSEGWRAARMADEEEDPTVSERLGPSLAPRSLGLAGGGSPNPVFRRESSRVWELRSVSPFLGVTVVVGQDGEQEQE